MGDVSKNVSIENVLQNAPQRIAAANPMCNRDKNLLISTKCENTHCNIVISPFDYE